MTCEKFESVMGYHCSPVLMGMKPANLVSFSKEKMPELPAERNNHRIPGRKGLPHL